MSTILKALRRLEEEDAKGGKGGSAASPGANIEAADSVGGVLRGRILAEEAVANALAPSSAGPGHRSQKLRVIGVAAAAIFFLAIGTIGYLDSNGAGLTSPRSEGSAAELIAAAERPTRLPPRAALTPTTPRPLPRRAPLPAPRPTNDSPPIPVASAPVAASANANPGPQAAPPLANPAPPLEIAAVRPIPAVTATPRHVRNISALPEVSAESMASESEAQTSRATRATEQARAEAKPDRAPTPDVSRSTVVTPNAKAISSVSNAAALSPADSSSALRDRATLSAKPSPSPSRSFAESRSAEAPEVKRIDDPGLPDIVVLRTSWHPSADRRSARLRVVASNDVLTLREGDAIGGFVVREITPSSVLFQAGAVEIRRKVGANH